MFLDESGNLDFSEKGTKYFLLTAVTKERPFNAFRELVDLKYDLIEAGLNIEYFHAAEDRQEVRNKVFAVIRRHLDGVRIDSLAVEKAKTHVGGRAPEHFYPKMLGALIKSVLGGVPLEEYRELVIMTDSVPMQKKRAAIEKAVKLTLAEMLPPGCATGFSIMSRSPMWICRWPTIAAGLYIGNAPAAMSGRTT